MAVVGRSQPEDSLESTEPALPWARRVPWLAALMILLATALGSGFALPNTTLLICGFPVAVLVTRRSHWALALAACAGAAAGSLVLGHGQLRHLVQLPAIWIAAVALGLLWRSRTGSGVASQFLRGRLILAWLLLVAAIGSLAQAFLLVAATGAPASIWSKVLLVWEPMFENAALSFAVAGVFAFWPAANATVRSREIPRAMSVLVLTAALVVATDQTWYVMAANTLTNATNSISAAFIQAVNSDQDTLTGRASSPPLKPWVDAAAFQRSMRPLIYGKSSIIAMALLDYHAGRARLLYGVDRLGINQDIGLQMGAAAADAKIIGLALDSGTVQYLGVRPIPGPEIVTVPSLVLVAAMSGAPKGHSFGLAMAISIPAAFDARTTGGLSDTHIAVELTQASDATNAVLAAFPAITTQVPTESQARVRGLTRSSAFQLGAIEFTLRAAPVAGFGVPFATTAFVIGGELLGGLAAFILILQMATSSQRRQRADRARDQLLQAAVAAAPGLVVVVDSGLRVLLTNQRFDRETLGNQDLVGLLPFALTAAQDVEFTQVVVAATTGRAGRLEQIDNSSSETLRFFDIQARPIAPESEVTAAAWVQVMETTHARLREARNEQSERLESLGSMARGLAHDFNNLLFIVGGYLQLAMDSDPVRRDAQVTRYLEQALDASTRGTDIASSLMSVAGGRTLQLSRVDVPSFVNRFEPIARRTLGKSHDLEVCALIPKVELLVDSGQLSSALLNLVINARDALGGAGEVRISGELISIGFHDEDLAPGQYLSLSVVDNGSGMSPEVLARVFEPYFTTKPPEEGTGLGLATAYAFIRQSGGNIRLTSEVGVGSTASLVLPLAPAEALAQPLDSSIETVSKVLIVEDEPALCLLVAGWLGSFGLETRAANDPAEALVAFDEFAPDVILSDMNLGVEMDGLELAGRIAFLDPDVRIVFMTGFSSQMRELSERGLPVLAKPFGRDALRAAILPNLDSAAPVQAELGLND